MKNFFLGMALVLVLGGIGFFAYQTFLSPKKSEETQMITPTVTVTETQQNESRFPSSSPTATPTIFISPTSSAEFDKQQIKAALIKKNNWPANDPINVSVSTNDGTYASGSAGGEGGGGYFFAKKVNGEWVIVADGNGVITCEEMKAYPDYPTSLIPECYDETTQNSVKR